MELPSLGVNSPLLKAQHRCLTTEALRWQSLIASGKTGWRPELPMETGDSLGSETPTVAPCYFTYRRTRERDTVTEKTADATVAKANLVEH